MKRFPVLLACAMAFVCLFPRDLTLSFGFPDREMRGLLGAMGAEQLSVKIHADSIDAKFYEFWLVDRDSVKTERRILGFAQIEPDSTEICVTVVPADSVTAHIFVTPSNSPRITKILPPSHFVLIECLSQKSFSESDTIPLIAYSPGIEKIFDIGGKPVTASDICGVRFSGLHPADWPVKLGTGRCIYLEAIPVSNIDYSKFN